MVIRPVRIFSIPRSAILQWSQESYQKRIDFGLETVFWVLKNNPISTHETHERREKIPKFLCFSCVLWEIIEHWTAPGLGIGDVKELWQQALRQKKIRQFEVVSMGKPEMFWMPFPGKVSACRTKCVREWTNPWTVGNSTFMYLPFTKLLFMIKIFW